MALKAENKSGGTKDVPQAGNHFARLVGMVDLGEQPGFEYKGKEVGPQYKVNFIYELVNSLMEDGRPHWVSEDFKVSNWIGKNGGFDSTMMSRVKAIDVADDSNMGDDLTKLLGKPCMVTVAMTESGWPKVAGQAAVSMIPGGMEVPELKNESFFFDMDEPDMHVWERLTEFTKDKIKQSLQFHESKLFQELAASDEL